MSPGLAVSPPLRGEDKEVKAILGSDLSKKLPHGRRDLEIQRGDACVYGLCLCQIPTVEGV